MEVFLTSDGLQLNQGLQQAGERAGGREEGDARHRQPQLQGTIVFQLEEELERIKSSLITWAEEACQKV